MPIPCVVVPRRGATREDLNQLGRALIHFARHGGVRCRVDAGVLGDLLGGNRPTQALTPGAEGISFTVGARGYDRRRTLDSLRRHVPAELVEDVLVEGRSWQQVE